MVPSLAQRGTRKNSHNASNCCSTISRLGRARRRQNVTIFSSGVAITRNRPRQNADEAWITFLSDIKPDSRYGLSPIVPFQFSAEVRIDRLTRSLAPLQAKPGILSGGVSSILRNLL